MAKRSGIGRATGKLAQGKGSGVSHLLKGMAGAREAGAESLREVPPDQIDPAPWQPRRNFDPDALQELAESIQESGLLQPLLVRPQAEHFELLAGERRLRAAKLAGLASVPVRVRDASDLEARLITRAENRDREDLTAWENAVELAQLRDAVRDAGGKATVRELAKAEDSSTGAVSENLRIADRLTPAVLERAGIDVQTLNTLPREHLVNAAKAETDRERAALLHMSVHGVYPDWARENAASEKKRRGRPPKPYTLSVRGSGRLSFSIRRPEEIDQTQARDILEKLEPVVRSLRERANLKQEDLDL